MHILYIFGFQYSLKIWENSGAIGREFEFFIKMGEKFDTKYTLLTYGDKSDHFYNLPSNVDLIAIYNNKNKRFNKFFDFILSIITPFKIYKKLGHIDIIKTNQLHGSWVALIFKFLLKKPLFIRTGYDAFLFSKHQSKNKIKQVIFYIQTFLALKFCQIYSVTSISDKLFLEKLFHRNKFLKKISLRPNWIRDSESPKNFFDRDKDFIAIGRLESQKNYHYLINSFHDIKQKLKIVGEGSQKEELQNFISELNLNIEIVENINYDILIQKLKEYKFFILSSKYEGNPKVLLEAMSAGCIPLVSDIPNHTEIISHGKNGFIFSINSKSSLNKLIKSLSNFKNLDQISYNAHQHVIKYNSLSNSLKKEQGDFEVLLSEND